MVVRQPDYLESWHVAIALKAFEFRNEPLGTFYVGVSQIKAPIPRIKMTVQGLHARSSGVRDICGRSHEFAIAAIANAGFTRPVPNVTARRNRDWKIAFARVRELSGLVVAIVQRPHLFDE